MMACRIKPSPSRCEPQNQRVEIIMHTDWSRTIPIRAPGRSWGSVRIAMRRGVLLRRVQNCVAHSHALPNPDQLARRLNAPNRTKPGSPTMRSFGKLSSARVSVLLDSGPHRPSRWKSVRAKRRCHCASLIPFRHRRSHRLMTVPHRRETVFLSNTVSNRRAGLQPPPP